eukprot:1967030-Pyramimonas_sp.AAC.1
MLDANPLERPSASDLASQMWLQRYCSRDHPNFCELLSSSLSNPVPGAQDVGYTTTQDWSG